MLSLVSILVVEKLTKREAKLAIRVAP